MGGAGHKTNEGYYAHMEIVVVLIVVKFGVFLVIARNPPDGF